MIIIIIDDEHNRRQDIEFDSRQFKTQNLKPTARWPARGCFLPPKTWQSCSSSSSGLFGRGAQRRPVPANVVEDDGDDDYGEMMTMIAVALMMTIVMIMILLLMESIGKVQR